MNSFDNVIGYEEEKFELERICDIMKNPEKYKKLGVTTPRGVLIEGEPGLGKTLMAKSFIKESGRKVFTCRKDKPNADFINEIRESFEKAKNEAPSIVFLDDIDKFANEDCHHRNAEEFVTIQSCIDDCKDYEVFVLATANETNCLPESLLRAGRFDKTLTIEAPKYKDAVKIVKYYLDKKNFMADVDVEEITKILSGRSCAELETVINEAGIYAGYAGKDVIEMDDMIKACLRIIFHAPEAIKSESAYLKEVAYHEAGHALIHELLEPGSINLVSIATYTGDIGGITSYYQDENYFKDKKFMENRVMCILGGRAATELVFGTTDTGANRDLHRAFDICERFIDNFCSFGFGMFEGCNSGNDLLNRKDMGVAIEMEHFYSETKHMIAENRELLDMIVAALMEKKTLLRKDIQEIKAAYKKAA